MTTLTFILLTFLLSKSFIHLIAVFAVLTVGILHGANDLEILSKRFKGKSNHLYFKFLTLYLLIVIIGMALFFVTPAFALFFFVIFSSYHFGEQHWGEKLTINPTNFIFYTLYGALIFFILFSFQYTEVLSVINKISGYTIGFDFFLNISIILGITVFIWMLLNDSLRVHIFKECILLILLAAIFYVDSLFFAFAFYFVVWHSLPSLREQLIYLYGDFNFNSCIRYLKTSIIYWIASLGSLFMVYRYIDFEADYFMPLFFSFLAAITFPHTVVIGMMKYTNR
tara:strand:+ start:6594 stop:7439 length:846 start_codon:yes stop_codon:yes gene_type:complete